MVGGKAWELIAIFFSDPESQSGYMAYKLHMNTYWTVPFLVLAEKLLPENFFHFHPKCFLSFAWLAMSLSRCPFWTFNLLPFCYFLTLRTCGNLNSSLEGSDGLCVILCNKSYQTMLPIKSYWENVKEIFALCFFVLFLLWDVSVVGMLIGLIIVMQGMLAPIYSPAITSLLSLTILLCIREKENL